MFFTIEEKLKRLKKRRDPLNIEDTALVSDFRQAFSRPILAPTRQSPLQDARDLYEEMKTAKESGQEDKANDFLDIINWMVNENDLHKEDVFDARPIVKKTIARTKAKRLPPNTTKVANHADLAETIRGIFRKAGVPVKLKDSITVNKLKTGYSIKISTAHTEINYRKLMSLKAYMTHTFKATKFIVTPTTRNGKSFLNYVMFVTEIKLDGYGNPKLTRVSNKIKPASSLQKERAKKLIEEVRKKNAVKRSGSKINKAVSKIKAKSKVGRKMQASFNSDVNFSRIQVVGKQKLRTLANIEGLN
jgi:hypothetical protein